ncbi:Uncharacterised protein [Afipia felis]|uniref:Uncharacterized protein n=2 Tax=Afipia felis TaxID=1035 RepID=A0A380W2J0_AFIFE|nr:hypothetical protein HMPREF9697_02878 [Afipia felis ATCC 53690]SUU75095.1 Uncharacterised protein [Afipia felis]SUU83161.1 Uncharacterised protein [Afipia felis]
MQRQWLLLLVRYARRSNWHQIRKRRRAIRRKYHLQRQARRPNRHAKCRREIPNPTCRRRCMNRMRHRCRRNCPDRRRMNFRCADRRRRRALPRRATENSSPFAPPNILHPDDTFYKNTMCDERSFISPHAMRDFAQNNQYDDACCHTPASPLSVHCGHDTSSTDASWTLVRDERHGSNTKDGYEEPETGIARDRRIFRFAICACRASIFHDGPGRSRSAEGA